MDLEKNTMDMEKAQSESTQIPPVPPDDTKETNTSPNNKKEKKTPGKDEQQKTGVSTVLVGVLIALLIIIASIYGYGAYYFTSHFFLNTYIDGKKVAGMTVEQAEKLFTEDFDSHILILTEKERKETINPADVGLVISVGSQVSDFLNSQNKWKWFLNIQGRIDNAVALDVTYDKKKLKETVNALDCFKKENIVAPKSAYIKKGEKGIELVPEVLGNTVKKKELIAAIETAFSTCSTSINLKEADLYKKPTVYRTNKKLKAAYKKAKKYASTVLIYDFNYTTVTVDYKKFKNWLVVKSNLKVYFDEDKVESYVSKLCNDFNTIGIYRKFHTSTGDNITIKNGDYGWMISYSKEFEQLKKDLKSGKKKTREPIYAYKGMCRYGAEDDIGDSYVEVSISNQTLWLYIDGDCILESPVVTGDVTRSGRSTHKGIWGLTYKQKDATLSGQGYSSPVKYWMPFNGNEGLHDASWRSNFGGSIYKGSGSHGCVNCPPSTAKKLYKYVHTGFPVIVW